MLLEKICIDCGFESLTEEEIAAPYDFEPNNDVFGEEEIDETEVMDGISAEIIPTESLGENMSSGSVNISSSASVRNKPVQKAVSPTLKNKPVNVSDPFKNPTISGVAEFIAKDFVETVKKHWWKMLITLLFPIIGFLIGLGYAMLGFGTDSFNENRNMNFGLIFKGVGYMAVAGLLMKMGIGFTFI